MTTTTYGQVGVREDLSNQIYNIAPTETPFTTLIKKGAAAKNKVIEWQTDTLASASGSNAVIEGADATIRTFTATVRIKNYCQLMDKAIQVSTSANAVTAAGREEELAYQLEKRTKELKRDLETRLTGNYASDDGSALTARQLAGFEAWITTNDFRKSGTASTQGGYNSGTGLVSAGTDGSSTRTFTETLLKAGIKAAWDAGGEPSIVMVGSFNKQAASSFSGNATKYNIVDGKVSSNTIVGAADLYASDFGVFKIVANRFSRSRAALGIDPDYISLHYLQPWSTVPLSRTGHSEKRLMSFEVSMAMRNQAAHFCILDLSSS